MDNRLQEDEVFSYQHDVYGNLAEKRCHINDSEVHRYHYDNKHRLVRYAHTLSWSDGHTTTQGDYIYDPLGRRVGKCIVHLTAQGSAREDASLTWYGWDGDRLVLTEQDGQRVHTLYQPGSFVPLLRIEGDTPPVVPTLVQTLEQEAGIHFEPEVADQLHRLEGELRAGTLSAHSQQWLNHAQLKPDQLQALLKPAPERVAPRVHLYHCDHLGTPIALINQQGEVDWQAEFDAWGNQVAGRNPQRLYQPIRMQGQHYDEETGLHYNRHRYYDPLLGRYINQDPIGLVGGMNTYQYATDPVSQIDPLGLSGWSALGNGGLGSYGQGAGSLAGSMGQDGASPESINTALSQNAKGSMPEAANQYILGLTFGAPAVAGMAIYGPAAPLASVFAGAGIGGGANAGYQLYDLSLPGNENKSYNFTDTAVACLSGAFAPGRGGFANIAIGTGLTYLKDGLDPGSLAGSVAGGISGGVLGKLGSVLSVPAIITDAFGGVASEIVGAKTKDAIDVGSKKEGE